MNYITKNTPSLHPSIIDGLIYFSKKNKGTLKKEQLIHFLGNDDNLSELNIIEAAQQLNLKCEFSFFNSESEYKDKIKIKYNDFFCFNSDGMHHIKLNLLCLGVNILLIISSVV